MSLLDPPAVTKRALDRTIAPAALLGDPSAWADGALPGNWSTGQAIEYVNSGASGSPAYVEGDLVKYHQPGTGYVSAADYIMGRTGNTIVRGGLMYGWEAGAFSGNTEPLSCGLWVDNPGYPLLGVPVHFVIYPEFVNIGVQKPGNSSASFTYLDDYTNVLLTKRGAVDGTASNFFEWQLDRVDQRLDLVLPDGQSISFHHQLFAAIPAGRVPFFEHYVTPNSRPQVFGRMWADDVSTPRPYPAPEPATVTAARLAASRDLAGSGLEYLPRSHRRPGARFWHKALRRTAVSVGGQWVWTDDGRVAGNIVPTTLSYPGPLRSLADPRYPGWTIIGGTGVGVADCPWDDGRGSAEITVTSGTSFSVFGQQYSKALAGEWYQVSMYHKKVTSGGAAVGVGIAAFDGSGNYVSGVNNTAAVSGADWARTYFNVQVPTGVTQIAVSASSVGQSTGDKMRLSQLCAVRIDQLPSFNGANTPDMGYINP